MTQQRAGVPARPRAGDGGARLTRVSLAAARTPPHPPTDAKQGRGKQFRTKEERDAHLRSQIEELAVARTEQEELLVEKQSKLSSLRKALAKDGTEAAAKRAELGEKGKLLRDLKRTVDEQKRERTELADARKEQWRAINELADKVGEAKEGSRRALYDMRKVNPCLCVSARKAAFSLALS